MNIRLKTILSMIEPGIGIADIGTDHGYIPIQLALGGYPGHLFASDIHKSPLIAAKTHAIKAGVEEKIHFVLSDGLHGIQPGTVDTVIIAGMGGDLICRIMDECSWAEDKALLFILQPMTKSEILRFWLVNNGFEIESETVVHDLNRRYKIMRVRFCGMNTRYYDYEYYTGQNPSHEDINLFLMNIHKKPESVFFKEIQMQLEHRNDSE